MGNQILKEYIVGDHPIASGGTNHIWKIYSGRHKSTKNNVSVFKCEVADITRLYGTDNKAKIQERLKIDTEIISKFRTSSTLKIIHPIADMKQSLVFITEPILGSVANLCFNEYDHVPAAKKQDRMNDIEVKLGLGQVLFQLQHLHAKGLTHLNVNPNNIYVTARGQWKLGGFHFCMSTDDQLLEHAKYKPSFASFNDFATGTHIGRRNYFLPPPDYSAPEYVLQDEWGPECDIYSFGMVYYHLLHEEHHQLMEANWNIKTFQNLITQKPVQEKKGKSRKKSKKTKGQFDHNGDLEVDLELYEVVKPLIQFNKNSRMTAKVAYKSPKLFGDEIKALRYIDKVNTKTPAERASFFTNLIKVLNMYPENILAQKILKPLLQALAHPHCRESALLNILEIVTLLPTRHFTNTILPTLQQQQVFTQLEPPKLPLLVLQYFRKLMEPATESEKKNTILPFLSLCLTSPHPEVQIDALNQCTMGVTNKYVPYPYFKENMLPIILELSRSTSEQIVRQCTINCIHKTVEFYETFVLVDNIIPVLKYILMVDKSAPVLMSVTFIFQDIAKQFTNMEDVATILIPALSPVLIEPTLSPENFEDLLRVFHFMLGMVTKSRYQYFKELKEAEISARTVNSKKEAREVNNNAPVPPVRRSSLIRQDGPSHISEDDIRLEQQRIKDEEARLKAESETQQLEKQRQDELQSKFNEEQRLRAEEERLYQQKLAEEERKYQEQLAAEEEARREEMNRHLEQQRKREEQENEETSNLFDKLEQAHLMRLKLMDDKDTFPKNPHHDDAFFTNDSKPITPIQTTPAEFLQSPTSTNQPSETNAFHIPEFGFDDDHAPPNKKGLSPLEMLSGDDDADEKQKDELKLTPLAFFDD